MNLNKAQDLHLEPVLRPIEQSTGLPNETYTSHGFLEREREQASSQGLFVELL